MTLHEDQEHAERERVAARLRVALELHETGIALQRQNLRRKHPGCTEAELETLFQQWLRDSLGWEAPGLRRREGR